MKQEMNHKSGDRGSSVNMHQLEEGKSGMFPGIRRQQFSPRACQANRTSARPDPGRTPPGGVGVGEGGGVKIWQRPIVAT